MPCGRSPPTPTAQAVSRRAPAFVRRQWQCCKRKYSPQLTAPHGGAGVSDVGAPRAGHVLVRATDLLLGEARAVERDRQGSRGQPACSPLWESNLRVCRRRGHTLHKGHHTSSPTVEVPQPVQRVSRHAERESRQSGIPQPSRLGLSTTRSKFGSSSNRESCRRALVLRACLSLVPGRASQARPTHGRSTADTALQRSSDAMAEPVRARAPCTHTHTPARRRDRPSGSAGRSAVRALGPGPPRHSCTSRVRTLTPAVRPPPAGAGRPDRPHPSAPAVRASPSCASSCATGARARGPSCTGSSSGTSKRSSTDATTRAARAAPSGSCSRRPGWAAHPSSSTRRR